MLSVVIPSHNDVYLNKTISSLLENADGEIEVIPVLDGYVPSSPLIDDPRVFPVYLPTNEGMREAINVGVQVAQYPYIMRSDEHCLFAKGYDVALTQNLEPNWIATPIRYKLDPIRWEIMEDQPIIYERLIILHKPGRNVRKFSAIPWRQRDVERKHLSIDETMAMQGSCWVMTKQWWEETIGRLDSVGYGTLYQDSTEMVFKTWEKGGKLMVNKLTWFAHKHRDFNRTHNYPGELARKAYAFALERWEKDYERVKKQWGI